MHVTVHGARLFFDTVGPLLEPGSGGLRRRPTLLVLHGGPGWDHSPFRSFFDRFADQVQVVYLDHRGNGRSLGGNGADPDTWTLAQWGDDIAEFCEVLGIEKPIVYGQSFGGMVAQSYAARHPELPGALVFSSTAATFDLDEVLTIFESLGGAEIRDIAERFWTRMNEDDLAEYLARCLSFYTYGFGDPVSTKGTLFNPDVLRHFSSGPGETDRGEIHRMDLRPGLDALTMPILVLTGDRDPVTSPARAREIHAALGPNARYVEVANAGHGTYRDQPVQSTRLIRDFLRTAEQAILAEEVGAPA